MARRVACVFLSSMILLAVNVHAETPQTEAAVRDGIVGRLAKMQDIVVSFEAENRPKWPKDWPTKSSSPNGMVVVMQTEPTFTVERFCFLSGLVRYERKLTKESLKNVVASGFPDIEAGTYIYTKDRVEQLTKAPDQRVMGAIFATASPPPMTVDAALGLRKLGGSNWFTADMLAKAAVRLEDKDMAVVETEDVVGKDTFVTRYTYNRRLGYALVKYEVVSQPGNKVVTDFKCDDFREVGGLMVPFGIVQRGFSSKVTEAINTLTIRVTEYRINEPANNASEYRLKWPKGIEVTDDRIHENFVTTKDDQVIDDELIHQALQKGKVGPEDAAVPAGGAATKP